MRSVHAHGQKTVENLDRAAGPSWVVAGRGPRAAGPTRAVGLFLAKPGKRFLTANIFINYKRWF